MDAVVTNDGAPKHIAVAVKTPTVTVHGPTDYRAWGPSANPAHRAVYSSEPCAPCEKMKCPYEAVRCMEGISPERVYKELRGILK